MKYNIIRENRALDYPCNDLNKIIFNNSIGDTGKNLTIVILSLNRSNSTIKLIDSIEKHLIDYEGKILLIDNGSKEEEKKAIKKRLKRCEIENNFVELDKNYGVAGGRNKAIEYVDTDWIMNLDNDIYFINNPIKKINKAICTLGCHFINMPLLDESGKRIFSNGGALYVSYRKGDFYVGGGSFYEQGEKTIEREFENSLSNFLFGGASIIKKDTFVKCGMFDENMFIGFEDTDFSLRLYNMGYKIGSVGTFSLIHNHMIDEKNLDKNYEKIRFSSEIIKQSGLYFEKKNGLKVLDENVELWLEQRKKELGISDIKKTNKNRIQKKKIALVVDVENWAFGNIAKQIKKNLSKYYDIDIICMDKIGNNIVRLFMLLKDYDLIHFFWRVYLANIRDDYARNYLKYSGIDYEDFMEYIGNLNITTSIYDHLFLDNKGVEYTNYLLEIINNYTVSSRKLYDIYNTKNYKKKPLQVITDGVDFEIFKPLNLKRFDELSRTIVIGWVGNSEWSGEIEDFKGFKTILKPAIEELIKEGYNIEEYYADRQIRMIPHKEMCKYYSKIDILICTSKVEGTPNPVLEAMACGVPIISTDVGIVPEVFGKLQSQYILKERTIGELKKVIIELIQKKQLLKKISKENLNSIENWSWIRKTKEFKLFFDKNISKKEEKNESNSRL